jgi:hypothetical protein
MPWGLLAPYVDKERWYADEINDRVALAAENCCALCSVCEGGVTSDVCQAEVVCRRSLSLHLCQVASDGISTSVTAPL